jgi:hypothetical protein
MLATLNYDICLIQNKIALNIVHFVLLAARFIYLLILIFLLKNAQKNKTFNKHLTSKLQFSPKFTLNSVADSNYRGKCDVGGFLNFECTIPDMESWPTFF